jgi:hypothetical protein
LNSDIHKNFQNSVLGDPPREGMRKRNDTFNPGLWNDRNSHGQNTREKAPPEQAARQERESPANYSSGS